MSFLTQSTISRGRKNCDPDENIPWLFRYKTIFSARTGNQFGRFLAEEGHHSEIVSDEKCYLYSSMRRIRSHIAGKKGETMACQVSMLGPLAYEPRTLPLRHMPTNCCR